jgi:DNA-binding XRE family transcriptional regulator
LFLKEPLFSPGKEAPLFWRRGLQDQLRGNRGDVVLVANTTVRPMHPGRIIKLLRTVEDIAQFDLAQRLNVSRPYLSQVENGKKEPGLVFLRNAARVLNVPVALLLMDEAASEAEITYEMLARLLRISRDDGDRSR